jgi:plasmid maintenance system antidote protein VapI
MRTATQARAFTLAGIMEKHDLDQRALARGTGLSLSVVNSLVNERTSPTTGTVNRLLAFLRKYEPRVTYEDLFA